LHADHNFPLPPYEEIDEEMYKKLLGKIDFTIPLYVSKATKDEINLDDCATGACPIK
jgi:hypothetical protein